MPSLSFFTFRQEPTTPAGRGRLATEPASFRDQPPVLYRIQRVRYSTHANSPYYISGNVLGGTIDVRVVEGQHLLHVKRRPRRLIVPGHGHDLRVVGQP